MVQTVPAKNDIYGWNPVSGDVQNEKRPGLAGVQALVLRDEVGHDISSDVIYCSCYFRMPHPVEIAAGRIEQCLGLEFLE